MSKDLPLHIFECLVRTTGTELRSSCFKNVTFHEHLIDTFTFNLNVNWRSNCFCVGVANEKSQLMYIITVIWGWNDDAPTCFAVFWGSQRVFFLDNRRAPGPEGHGTNNGDEIFVLKKSPLKRVFPRILTYGVFEVLKCLVRTTGRGSLKTWFFVSILQIHMLSIWMLIEDMLKIEMCIGIADEVPTHVYNYCHFRLKWWSPES